MSKIKSLEHLDARRFDTSDILRKLTSSSRRLAELKGIAASIPNQGILINTLGLQEAKDSSEIENIITTHDRCNAVLLSKAKNSAKRWKTLTRDHATATAAA